MITHIHQSFETAPGLRRWSYYCFYCLQATLVLLPQTADDNAAHDLLCKRAVEVFEQIKLKVSQRCAKVVRQFLGRRAKRQRQDVNTEHANHADGISQPPMLDTLGLVQQPTAVPDAMLYRTTGQIQEVSDPLASIQDQGDNSASVFSFDNNNTYWPFISPSAFQIDLYGALYSIDPNDYLGHQPYFFGSGGLPDDIFANHNSDWSHYWNS